MKNLQNNISEIWLLAYYTAGEAGGPETVTILKNLILLDLLFPEFEWSLLGYSKYPAGSNNKTSYSATNFFQTFWIFLKLWEEIKKNTK